MNARTQITLDPETQRRARARAAELGISFTAYLRGLLADDLGPPKPERKADISVLFDLVDEGPPTDIARDKDEMVGQAVWDEYLCDIGEKPQAPRAKTGRR
jgi:hypothetical protein